MTSLRIFLVFTALLFATSLPCLAGDVRIEVRGEIYAPAKLWVAPVATEKQVKTWIEFVPTGVEHRNYSAGYRATLQPGRYALVAADVTKDRREDTFGAGYGPPEMLAPLPSITTPLRSLHIDATHFDVGIDSLDLGRIELMKGPGLLLMLRSPGAAGWVIADSGDDGDQDIARLRARLRWVSVPREMPDGRWLALASGNRMIVRNNDGHWSTHTVMNGGTPRLVAPVSADLVVIAGEGPSIELRRLDGSSVESLGINGLPAGLIEALHCDVDRHCAAGILTETSVELYYTPNAGKIDWQQIAVLDKVRCNPTCRYSAAFHALPGEILAIGDKGSTTRINLSNGAVERASLPFRHTASFFNNARLTARDRVSTDGGRSWQEFDTPPVYMDAQFDNSGRIFAMGFDMAFGYNRPSIRRAEDGGKRWPQISQPPTFGVHVVGGASPVQYMQQSNNLWISQDAGATWQTDHAAFEALKNDGDVQ